MLTKKQFDLLHYLNNCKIVPTQRMMATAIELSLGSVNKLWKEMEEKEYIKKGLLSEKGKEALAPYKVENAMIMAAGKGTRFVPLTYEIPKGLLRVKGEVLIERQIEQLRKAGIHNITVVVGYMQEHFFYLEDKYDVKIVINTDYYRYNNTSTLMAVLEELGNTYICSSDNYFVDNVFTPYVYEAYYAAQYATGTTGEYCITTNSHGVITDVVIGGSNSWYMMGHVYFSKAFSEKFSDILKAEYQKEETKQLLWEDVYIKHIDKLSMVMKPYDSHKILEFDSLDELREFDFSYVDNVDSSIMTNICHALSCKARDITQIRILKKAAGYMAFRFICKQKRYVYVLPDWSQKGQSVWEKKAKFLTLAQSLGMYTQSVYFDKYKGWEILAVEKEYKPLNPQSEDEVKKVVATYRKLHHSGILSGYSLNIWEEIERNQKEMEEMQVKMPSDFNTMYNRIKEIWEDVSRLSSMQTVLCYNGANLEEILIDEEKQVSFTNWQFAGDAHPACDIGSFISHMPINTHSMVSCVHIIEEYMQSKVSEYMLIPFVQYAAIMSFYWYVWILRRKAEGALLEDKVYHYYKATRFYATSAQNLVIPILEEENTNDTP